MLWFYNVSYPIMSDFTFVTEDIATIPPYKEVIVQQRWTRQVPNHSILLRTSELEWILERDLTHVVL